MATASNVTNPPPPHRSPRTSAVSADTPAISSPRSRRSSSHRGGASSPWTHIVRAPESEFNPSSSSTTTSTAVSAINVVPTLPPPSSNAFPEQIVDGSDDYLGMKPASEASNGVFSLLSSNEEAVATEVQLENLGNGGGSNAGKKPAWNNHKSSNEAAEVSLVMDAVSWPALSGTKASAKSASSDSLKNLSDGSTSAPQATEIGPSSSHNQGSSSNAKPSTTPSHVAPARQRAMRRGGGSGGGNSIISANGGFSQAPAPPGLVVEAAPINVVKPGNSSGESSSKENTPREGGQRGGFGSQPHTGNEHQQHRNSFRRGNGGPHPRGDGSHHHYHGGRRDQDRGNQEFSHHRNFGHVQTQRGSSRPFIRGPPHANTPYIPPPAVPVRPPFGAPFVYPDMSSPLFYVHGPPPDSFRAVPPFGPIIFPVADPYLHQKIVKQIDYYFSNENLVKDTYLRQNMDEQGWVSIKLIAGFKKVSQLTEDVQLILNALQSSTIVEVEGEKVRRRDDWMKWIIPRSVQYSPVSSPQFVQISNHDFLAEHLQSVALDEKKNWNVHIGEYPSRSSSGEFSSQSYQSGNEMIDQVPIQGGQPTFTTTK